MEQTTFNLKKFIAWCQRNNYSFYDTSKAYDWAKEYDGLTLEEIKEKNDKMIFVEDWFEELDFKKGEKQNNDEYECLGNN